MNDGNLATHFLVDGLTVYIATSAIKPFLEASFLPPKTAAGAPNPLHDPTIRLLAFVIGIIAQVVIYLVFTAHTDAPGSLSAAATGLAAALAAIGTFHVTTANYFDGT